MENRFKSALDFPLTPMHGWQEKMAQQKKLLMTVQSVLPREMAEHARHCLIKDGQLLIYTDSPNWASQIRFFSEGILNKISLSGQRNILNLQLRVIPSRVESSRVRTPHLPSPATVRQIGRSFGDDSNDPLNQALCRLFRTLAKRIASSDHR